MITIQETPKSKFLKDPKKSASCPHCEKEFIFFGISPDKCAQCNTLLINFMSIVTSRVYRANYHTGVIDNCGFMKMFLLAKGKTK